MQDHMKLIFIQQGHSQVKPVLFTSLSYKETEAQKAEATHSQRLCRPVTKPQWAKAHSSVTLKDHIITVQNIRAPENNPKAQILLV